MSYSLSMFGRATGDEPFIKEITGLAENWRRSSRAIGGYWAGSFRVDSDKLTRNGMTDFYNQRIGAIVREYTAGGIVSWEGYIAEMRLILDGVEHMRSLTPQAWHNNVAVYHTWPSSDDSEQGNLEYNPASQSPADAFVDDGQDFTDWETTAGDSLYRIKVTNSDDTVAWAFLGDTFTETNPDDGVLVYEDLARTEEGWPSGNKTHVAKTPSTYLIERIDLAGERANTGFSENTDSSEEYGEMQFIDSQGSIPAEVATFLRDRHLTQFAWPRSRMVGGISPALENTPDQLIVLCLGFWHTINWRYRTTAEVGAISDLISTLVGESEFVTAGRIETNGMAGKADAGTVPQRLGDVIAMQIELGDDDGDVWQGGVYAGKELRYEEAPKTVGYFLRGGRLIDKAGVAVNLALVEPGFLTRVSDVMLAGLPPGTANVWDDPAVAYVDEVEFVAPDQLRLRLFGEEESVLLLQRQLRSRQ